MLEVEVESRGWRCWEVQCCWKLEVGELGMAVESWRWMWWSGGR